MNKVYAVILAGGKGLRMGENTPKQFLTLGDKPIILWSIDAFVREKDVDHVIVVTPEEHIDQMTMLINTYHIDKVLKVIVGGTTRQGSSYNAVNSYNFNSDDILILHDAARPFITSEIIINCITETEKFGATGVYVPATDTITEIVDDFVKTIPSRDNLYNTQTPQSFKYNIIKASHEKALSLQKRNYTDDVSLAIDAGYKVRKINGDYNNIKITTPFDYYIAQLNISKKFK